MIKKILLFTILLFLKIFPLPSSEQQLLLKNQLHKYANPGDFIVTFYKSTYTFLYIHSKNDTSIIIEEVSIPKHQLPKNKTHNWKKWFSSGGKHHTSWLIYEVHLEDGKVQEYYSFSRKSWLEIDGTNNLFATLLTLPFSLVPEKERHKIGPPPPPGDIDRRSVWNPSMTLDGTLIKNVPFDSWRTYWPRDGSELAGKYIEIYLPHDHTKYAAYYPHWLHISNSFGTVKIRVVDSGNKAVSPNPFLPRPPPVFINSGSFIQGSLQFEVKGPSYYKDYLLWALPEGQIHSYPISLQCTITKNNSHTLSIVKVLEKELQKKLEKNSYYRFLIVAKDYDRAWAETEIAIIGLPSK